MLFRNYFFKIVLFKTARKTQSFHIVRSKLNQTVIFLCKVFFKVFFLKIMFSSKSCLLEKLISSKSCFLKKIVFSEICRVVKFLFQKLTRCIFFQNLTRCKTFISKSDALWNFCFKIWRFRNFNSKSDKFQTFFCEIWFLSCFSGSDWMMISSVNVYTNLFWRGELKVNACYRFSRQVYNWQLPRVSSSLHMWLMALWQHTIFTVVTDKNLWSITCSRSAVFLEKHLCENKRKRALVRIPSIFSKVFVWATRWRAMERSWHLHSIYPVLAAGRNLPQAWHSSKLTMLNRKSNFKTCVTQNIP